MKEMGYENFKKTIAHNCFTWIPDWKFYKDDQIKYLYLNLPLRTTIKNFFRAFVFKMEAIFLILKIIKIYQFLEIIKL